MEAQGLRLCALLLSLTASELPDLLGLIEVEAVLHAQLLLLGREGAQHGLQPFPECLQQVHDA